MQSSFLLDAVIAPMGARRVVCIDHKSNNSGGGGQKTLAAFLLVEKGFGLSSFSSSPNLALSSVESFVSGMILYILEVSDIPATCASYC